jgi:hypothetical protein
VVLLGDLERFAIPVHTFSVLPAHVNSAINPILYYFFNSKIKNGIHVLICRNKQIEANTSTLGGTKSLPVQSLAVQNQN